MPTSPQRRTRIRRAHQLRQQGNTLRQIAQHLNVAHSTIADDLKLLETQPNQLTAAIAHDLLLEHTLQLRDRVLKLRNQDPLHPLQRFPITDELGRRKTRASEASAGEIARFYALHERALNHAEREYRYALQQLAHTDLQIDEQTLDYPDDQLAAQEPPAQPAQPVQPAQPNNPEQPRTTLNTPEQLPTIPDRATPARPDKTQPQPAPTHPAQPRTNPNAPAQPRPPAERLTHAQLTELLETHPPDINALNNLLQHPERFPDYPPALLDLFKDIIAKAVNAAHKAA